ncbi:uncharacterized protein GIQ15_05769 [Arthroderma uncinatum]|uniref:uncharacterized protein n=1 Tax=Arthroderma uncinatum TaxID=74035 RepID=UPI00144A8EE7|nr:uncharacterized protein GIQ15_05769 [Arthroderma uncinatum]KAF3480422.1 hypothetical protein GIQ15_05769 [Arthroderma uncinatum]
MDKPFGKLIRSNLFTFHIGPEKVPFVVNSEAIAKQSPALNALINRNMIEAHSKIVDWPDVDEDTFVRFCEFCYRDDYSPPSCAWDISTDEKEEPPQEARATSNEEAPLSIYKYFDEPDAELSPSPFPRKGKNGKKAPSEPQDLLSDSDYSPPEHLTHSTQQFKPFSNVCEDQDFTPVLLGHAQLYVIADKYCIQPLKDLVLYKLYTTLKGFTIFPRRVGDIIALIRFTYDDGNTCGQMKETDPLRKLVTRYVVTKMEILAMEAAFLELLQDGGDFVTAFWKVVWERRTELLKVQETSAFSSCWD